MSHESCLILVPSPGCDLQFAPAGADSLLLQRLLDGMKQAVAQPENK